MEKNYTLKKFLKENGNLVMLYSFFIGVLAFSSNIKDSITQQDFNTVFFSLAIFSWIMPFYYTYRKLLQYDLPLMMYWVLSSFGNLTIAQSFFANQNIYFMISKIIYLVFIAFSAYCIYVYFRNTRKGERNYRSANFWISIILCIVVLGVYIWFRVVFIKPELLSGVGS